MRVFGHVNTLTPYLLTTSYYRNPKKKRKMIWSLKNILELFSFLLFIPLSIHPYSTNLVLGELNWNKTQPSQPKQTAQVFLLFPSPFFSPNYFLSCKEQTGSNQP
jgi:hypothetical protein